VTRSMKDKVFLDTNIFVYAIDSSAELSFKRDIARILIREHIANESGVISIQVVQEFYQAATRRIAIPISTEDALQFIQYMSILDIVSANLDMVVAAVHLHKKHSFSFWDALILEAAKSAGCSQVLSEDLQHGFRIEGIAVKNPFSI
jgi:predicted nucleic acid-binding protein